MTKKNCSKCNQEFNGSGFICSTCEDRKNRKICGYCGGEVLEECLRPKCKEKQQKYWEERAQDKIGDYQSRIDLFNSFKVDVLTLEDYKEIKQIKQEVKKWINKLENSSIKLKLEQFQISIGELEKKFPERIKLKAKGKSQDCYHRNISWNDPFQKKQESFYCLDCGEDENKEFTKKFQRWYCKKVREWLEKNNLKPYQFTNKFLKKENFYNDWQKLERGEMFKDIKDEFFVFLELNRLVEKYLLDFAKENNLNSFDDNNHKNSNINKDNLNINRERERERESNLEPKNNHLIYWGLGIIGVSLIGLFSFLIWKNKK